MAPLTVASSSELAQDEFARSTASPQLNSGVAKRRWAKRISQDAPVAGGDAKAVVAKAEVNSDVVATIVGVDLAPPAPPAAHERQPRPARGRSFCLQHYHSTGCAGGAFAFRAAKMDPEKSLFLCKERREFRATTMQDIAFSLSDKQRGQGPRVGPFQRSIPGEDWAALPKYDYSTRSRSCAFNERMHVEWENHVDHILANDGKLPTASVVAKAGFRSCAPCCRDMLALARPTGKTFIMVDLAEQDDRGTFHFVCGDKYLPVPKEYLDSNQVNSLKRVVLNAQNDVYPSSEAIYQAVLALDVPVDAKAQNLYLGDRALLPAGCAEGLRGDALLRVLHAEHFARLAAEYGASILRDAQQLEVNKRAILACRTRAEEMVLAAWAPHLPALRWQLQAYSAMACSPLLPDDAAAYELLRRSSKVPQPAAPIALPAASRPRVWKVALRPGAKGSPPATALSSSFLPLNPHREGAKDEDDAASTSVSTAAPDDGASTLNGDSYESDLEDECL